MRITDFVFTTGLILCSSEIFKSVLRLKSRKTAVWPCAAAMIAVSFFAAPNAMTFKTISRIYVPAINLFFVFVIFPVIFLIGRLRKKI